MQWKCRECARRRDGRLAPLDFHTCWNTVEKLNTADFNEPITFSGVKPRGLGVEYNFAHAVFTLDQASDPMPSIGITVSLRQIVDDCIDLRMRRR
jgi:hypothetical protein